MAKATPLIDQITAVQNLCARIQEACEGQPNVVVIAALGQCLAEAVVMTTVDQTPEGIIDAGRRVAEQLTRAIKAGAVLVKGD